MLSAVYDGHINSNTYNLLNLNNQVVGRWGIRNFSPKTRVVLAGTADLRYDYLYFLKQWWDQNRGIDNYPFDIVNYHFYSTTSHPPIDGSSPTFATWEEFYRGRRYFDVGGGAFPESSNVNLRGRIGRVLMNRATPPANFYQNNTPLFPNKPTWITEFGYDTKGQTAISITPFCGMDAQTIQGQWVTRYFLEASAVREGGLYVDKVFMYELNDDPSLGNGLFGNTGLLKTDGSPKKSWYHLLTLKSVLDRSRFGATNTAYDEAFLQNGTMMLADDPRIYVYNNTLSQKTIVAWVPKGEAADCATIQYDGAILLRKSTFINDEKPTVQIIEVVENDEDGRRTQVDPSLIESHVATLPGGNTEVAYWRINGIRPGDTHLTLTETPLYLRINQQYMESDRVVPPVDALVVRCLGCRTYRLDWKIPTGADYGYYAVYYQTYACGGAVPSFDPQRATLLYDRLPGNSTSAVVADLDISSSEPGACYVFWVIPYGRMWNTSNVIRVTYSPVDMTNPDVAAASTVTIETPFNTCGPCASIASNSQLTITQNPWGDNSFLLGEFYNAVHPPAETEVCNELIGIAPPSNFGLQLNNNQTVQFVIDFNQPQYINILYFFYSTGNGRVTIEYQTDCCPSWSKLKPIDIQDGSTGAFNNFWYSIANTFFNKYPIEKLRITIEGLPETGLNIKRFYFCTEPAPDNCAGDSPHAQQPDELLTPATDAQADYVDTHSAVIKWSAARRFINNQETDPIHRYDVRYGIATDVAGDIVQPVEVAYEGREWGGDNELPLAPLVPNTTYYVDIVPSIEADACLRNQPPQRVVFTTLPEPGQERAAPASRTQPTEVQLSPNPATDHLMLQVPPDTYTEYRLLHVNGVHIRTGYLPAQSDTHRIALRDLPDGVYVLSLIGSNQPIWSKAFVVSKK
jgi:hypothetical protein